MAREPYDIVILGGGPTGLFAAFYAGMRHMSTVIVDALPELGGQLAALYPEKDVFDVGGFPRILARDLANGLIEQAMRFDPAVKLGETAAELAPVDGDLWQLSTDRATYETRTVLIAAGIGAFRPRRLKRVPGLDALEGHGVHYGVRDKAALAGKRILIVGGGDSALDWANDLGPAAASAMLIHRREEFRAHEGTISAVRGAGRVEIRTHWEVRSVVGDGHLEQVTIYDNRTDEEETLDVDALLINVGFLADLGPIKSWGVEMEKRGVVVNERMETSLPGVYAAGDVAAHDGKLPLIATGFGEAAVAVNYAKTWIDPEARAFPGHSTEEKWR